MTARRDGKWMHYQISGPKAEAAAKMFADLMEMLDADEEMRADTACGSSMSAARRRRPSGSGAEAVLKKAEDIDH